MIEVDWIKQLNASIEYIEKNLDGSISSQQLSEIMMCSFENFQKVFSYISGKTLGVYIRERRLSKAGIELLESNEKIIDFAIKYGYSSQDAFTRAFKTFHGCLPSEVRKNIVQLNLTPKLSFQIKIIGEEQMNYRIEELSGFKVYGKDFDILTENAFEEVPKMWKTVKKDGTMETLMGMITNLKPCGILGIAANGQWGKSREMKYIVGVTKEDDPQVDNFKAIDFPKSTWVVFNVEKKVHVKKTYQDFYSIWLPNSEYKLADLPVIEAYGADNTQEIWFAIHK